MRTIFFFLLLALQLMSFAQAKLDANDTQRIEAIAKDGMAAGNITDDRRIPAGTVMTLESNGYKTQIALKDWTTNPDLGCPINLVKNAFVPRYNTWFDSVQTAQTKHLNLSRYDSLDIYSKFLISCDSCKKGLFPNNVESVRKCIRRGCIYLAPKVSNWAWVALGFFLLFVLLIILGGFNAAKERKASDQRIKLKTQEETANKDFLVSSLPDLLEKLSLKEVRVIMKGGYIFTNDEDTLTPIKEGDALLSLQKDVWWDGMIIICKDEKGDEKKIFIHERKHYRVI